MDSCSASEPGELTPELQTFFDKQDFKVSKFGETTTGGNFYLRAHEIIR